MTHSRGFLEEGLWPDDGGPDDGGDSSESWTTIRLHSRGGRISDGWPFNGCSLDNACTSEWVTNDDDDDGYDDGEITTARYDHRSVWEALDFHGGGTRQGVLSAVTVYLDGCLIFAEHGPGWTEWRPYSKWPKRRNNESQS